VAFALRHPHAAAAVSDFTIVVVPENVQAAAGDRRGHQGRGLGEGHCLGRDGVQEEVAAEGT